MKPIPIVVGLSLFWTLPASLCPAQTTVVTALGRLDLSGALLPAGARRRLSDPRRHLSINAIAISPDGRLAALAHADAVICVWDLIAGREVRALTGHRAPVNALVFSPDGKSVASASDDGTVRIWDPLNGNENYRFWSHTKPVRTVAFAPDGATLASGGWDNKVLVWEPGPRMVHREFKVNGHVHAVAFTPDGQMIAAGTDDGVTRRGRVWAMSSDVDLFSFDAGPTTIGALAFSPDGRMLAATNEHGAIALVEVASGRRICGFLQSGPGRCLAFAPDGRTLASAAVGGTETGPRLWDVARAQLRHRFPGAAGSSFAVAFTPDGQSLLSAGRDATAYLWTVDREGNSAPRAALPALELDALWQKLKDPDPARAYPALWDMVSSPDAAVTFLQQKLHPARPVPGCQLLIAHLDSASFQERESAMSQLERLPGVVPELRAELTRPPGAETRRRLELLLGKLDRVEATPEWLRTVRALQVLEYIRSRQARAHLMVLAHGVPEARLTREAATVLRRLDAPAAPAHAAK